MLRLIDIYIHMYIFIYIYKYTSICTFLDMYRVRKYFGNYIFSFWDLIFFLWFNWEVETFQVGVGCPCRGGMPLKKQLEGGWGGGRSAFSPDAFAEHAKYVIRLQFVEFWGPCSQFFVASQKNILCP